MELPVEVENLFILLLKIRKQAQSGVAYAMPQITKLRFHLITILAPPEMES